MMECRRVFEVEEMVLGRVTHMELHNQHSRRFARRSNRQCQAGDMGDDIGCRFQPRHRRRVAEAHQGSNLPRCLAATERC